MIKVRGIELDVDVLEELNEFEWKKSRVVGDEFEACSPFREENRPSFYVNIHTGLFKDFGAEDENWKQGNFISLLSYLHNISYEEAENYLLEKYRVVIDDVEGLELKINLQMDKKEEEKYFTREELKPFLFRKKDYLLKRGISEEIQKKFVVGYWKERKAVAFFWLDAFAGKVVNVKFRSIKGKQFFYIRGGQPVRKHVFGLYHVIKEGHKKAWIVESEIDALYLWSMGIPAVALGGSHLSKEQKRKLLLSGVETFVIATDADKAGIRIKESIIKELGVLVELEEVELPDYAKDVNEVKPEDMLKVIESVKPVNIKINLHYNV